MKWREAYGLAIRHRELVLAAAFIGMASWELFEMLVLELPRGGLTALAVTVHSVQVLIVVGVAAVVIRAWQERRGHEDALARLLEQVVMAQEEERRRIAYELHDGIAPLIVSAKHHAEAGEALAAGIGVESTRELAKVGERLDRAIVETRRVLMALRPSAVDSLGLAEAVRQTLDEAAQEAGWSVRLNESLGTARVPVAVETAAFRIVQETLSNASRHARSSHVEVDLRRSAGWLQLDIRDDGTGFDETGQRGGRGLGLTGMRERARLLGGTCSIETARGRGTAVRVRLPLGPGTAHA
jgi:signal transduction histidine kinase